MIRLKQWAVEFLRWLIEPKDIILSILIVAGVVYLGLFSLHSETSIRSAGYFLQLVGMILAIKGLLKIREYFGQPRLYSLASSWIKRFPKWKKNTVVHSGKIDMHISISGKASAGVWSPDDIDLPTEERIHRIIINLERMRENQYKQQSSIQKLEDSHEKHKKTSSEQIDKLEEGIRSDLESFHTDGLMESIIGLVWVTIGITLSTIAPELYGWFY